RAADGSSPGACAALADALLRSGLHELVPLATRLRTARADGTEGGALRRLASRAGQVLRRSAAPRSPAPEAPAVSSGPRAEHWIVVASRAEGVARARAAAEALAADGVSVTFAVPGADAGTAS